MAARPTIYLTDDTWDYAGPPRLVNNGDPTHVLDLPEPDGIPTISAGIVSEPVTFKRGGIDLISALKYTARTATLTYTFTSGPAAGLMEAGFARKMTTQSIAPKLDIEVPMNEATKTLTEVNVKGGASTRAGLANPQAFSKLQGSSVWTPMTITTSGTAPTASGEVQIEDGLVVTFFGADVDANAPRQFLLLADDVATNQLADSDTELFSTWTLLGSIYANSKRSTEVRSSSAYLNFDGDAIADGTVTMTITCASSTFDCGRALRIVQNTDSLLRPPAC